MSAALKVEPATLADAKEILQLADASMQGNAVHIEQSRLNNRQDPEAEKVFIAGRLKRYSPRFADPNIRLIKVVVRDDDRIERIAGSAEWHLPPRSSKA